MSYLQQADKIFFDQAALDLSTTQSLTDQALKSADDGELFLEYWQSESLSLDDSRIKSASFDSGSGFGLRAVDGDVSGFAHASELSHAALTRACDTVKTVASGYGGITAITTQHHPQQLYTDTNPLGTLSFEDKVSLLQNIDSYARDLDPRIVQVRASLASTWRIIQILRPGGQRLADIRPLVRIGINITLQENGTMQSGFTGYGGREDYSAFVQPDRWQAECREALRQAQVNLKADAAPAGEMTVVLGSGWPGILLHEAIGHGLEGDFNRKKTSAFSDLIGQRIAAPGVNVVDDGTLPNRRGSLNFDDEGTPTHRTSLIEDGILVGYMQDRMNARLMNMQPTGNGRRQSFAHLPMPRMTNTYMLNGDHAPEEIIESVDKGIYAVNFGGGQVDITNGKFVFSCTEAYKIEKGKLGAAVKGATLIGNGPDALTRVSLIGNDCKLDPGIGTCGKNGQGVPVGVGQPTLRLDGLTVGGTAT